MPQLIITRTFLTHLAATPQNQRPPYRMEGRRGQCSDWIRYCFHFARPRTFYTLTAFIGIPKNDCIKWQRKVCAQLKLRNEPNWSLWSQINYRGTREFHEARNYVTIERLKRIPCVCLMHLLAGSDLFISLITFTTLNNYWITYTIHRSDPGGSDLFTASSNKKHMYQNLSGHLKSWVTSLPATDRDADRRTKLVQLMLIQNIYTFRVRDVFTGTLKISIYPMQGFFFDFPFY